MRRFFPVTAPILALALAALGSAQGGPRAIRPPAGSPQPITVDARAGTITPGPPVVERTYAHALEFANLHLSGFVGTDTGAAGCQWFDAGIKGAGNASDLMSRVDFAYTATSSQGNLTLGFYEGYTPGGGTPSTVVALFSLTGLPGTTGGSSSYLVSLNVDPAVPFADGPIGYSWTFETVDPVHPFLACVQSCTGPGPGPFGVIDQLDRRCPPNPAFMPFSFPGYFSSIALDILEAADLTSTVGVQAGDGINVDTLSAPPMILGGSWTASVGIGHAHGPSGAVSLRIRTGITNGANVFSPFGGRLTEVLIQGPLLATLAGSHNGVSGLFPTLSVPPTSGVYGLGWAAQATVLGGGFADLSLALSGQVGTQ
jgi:hypothetical protein